MRLAAHHSPRYTCRILAVLSTLKKRRGILTTLLPPVVLSWLVRLSLHGKEGCQADFRRFSIRDCLIAVGST